MDSRSFFLRFGKLLYQIDGIYDEYGKRAKLGPNFLWVLYTLNDGEKHSQKDISTTWSIPKSTVNTIVGDLEEMGMVEQTPIAGKRREMVVSLTPRGKEFTENCLGDLYQREANVFASLKNPEELLRDLEELRTALGGLEHETK